MDILNVLYGEKSREFRVVNLTSSPSTVVKVVNHIMRRSDIEIGEYLFFPPNVQTTAEEIKPSLRLGFISWEQQAKTTNIK